MQVQCPCAGRHNQNHSIQRLSDLVAGEAVDSNERPQRLTSDIAALLAPPKEPKKPTGLSCNVWVLAMVGLLFALTWYGFSAFMLLVLREATDPADMNRLAYVLIGLAGLYVVLLMLAHVVLLRTSTRRYHAELDQFQNALAQWRELYYCPQDNIVFHGRNRDPRPPERMAELLYPQ